MAKKNFIGEVVTNKMQNTVVVSIERLVRHPLYKKTMKRTSRIKADSTGLTINVGEFVKIEQTRPISKDKHFKVLEVVKKGGAKK